MTEFSLWMTGNCGARIFIFSETTKWYEFFDRSIYRDSQIPAVIVKRKTENFLDKKERAYP